MTPPPMGEDARRFPPRFDDIFMSMQCSAVYFTACFVRFLRLNWLITFERTRVPFVIEFSLKVDGFTFTFTFTFRRVHA